MNEFLTVVALDSDNMAPMYSFRADRGRHF